MSGLGCKPCLADPDLWLKPEVRDNGVDYSSYILCYFYDILVVRHNFSPALDRIDQFMKLKEGSIGDSDIYLGAKLKKVQISNDVWCWSPSQSKYVQEAVQNCQNHLKDNDSGKYELIANALNPFSIRLQD